MYWQSRSWSILYGNNMMVWQVLCRSLEIEVVLWLLDLHGVFVIAQSVQHTLPSSAGELLDLPSLVLAHQKMTGPENTCHYWPEILAHTGSVLLKACLWITFNKRNEGCPWGLGWDWGPFQKREALHWKTVVFYTGDIDGNARIHW